MRPMVRKLTVALSVALAVFMVFVLSSTSLAAATPVPATATSQTVWAYGYVKTVSVGPLTAANGWTYEGNATVGYSVILNQTNTSATTFELSVQRTMGVLFFVEFCLPSCRSPSSFANLTYHAWEVTDSFANFTTQGTVLENGKAVAAVALLNTSSTVQANLTEQGHSALPPGGGGALVHRSKYLSAAVSSVSNVSFATPLGLFPLNLTSAQSWSSSSAFNASGSAAYSYYYHIAGPKGNVSKPGSGTFTVSPSGTVTVEGSYSPQITVRFGGTTYPALRLAVVGPFSVREGFILIPSSVDLFGGSAGPWSVAQNGTATVSMSYLDAKASSGGHLGIAASSWLYRSGTTNPGDTSLAPGTGMNPATGAAVNPVANESIQGTPQSVAQAESGQQCLTTGAGCPGVPGSPNARGIFGAIVVVGVVVVVAAVIALVLVTERRRVPPTVYPNANLYPPGAARARPSAPVRAPGSPPPPPAEEDPLDHLW